VTWVAFRASKLHGTGSCTGSCAFRKCSFAQKEASQ